ncbi:hypothetical protein BY996DRAFT_7795488 [Phakopsora pachyrhizi]|nr:hypothetical protein BY996DRAFT_7795488 [Phakopsora pachyrhizi]
MYILLPYRKKLSNFNLKMFYGFSFSFLFFLVKTSKQNSSIFPLFYMFFFLLRLYSF